MLTIDGSQGEGGGQVLRSSLALSLVTGTPFRIINIRAARKKPGLMRQHLTAVRAAADVGGAQLSGAEIASKELTFEPKEIRTGAYRFNIGTAGSTTLVLQTVLPALLTAPDASELILEGGTHNMQAPPFDFLEQTFLPLVNRMGPRIAARLERPGFYPAGGGRIVVSVKPSETLTGFDLLERGGIKRRHARAIVARLPRHIAERELSVIAQELGWSEDCLSVEEVPASKGPGNVVMIEIECEHLTEVFTGFGQRGVSAEKVASGVVGEARAYLDCDVPVGRHLADQLLLPLALSTNGGAFRTLEPSRHTQTHVDVVRLFLNVDIAVDHREGSCWQIGVRPL
jgi:RNA 3'-terminal phosphate cyclase (ATP)